MAEFQIWHWVRIKELESLYPHGSFRNMDDYWTCAKELNELGYFVMTVPDKKSLCIDTRMFGQR